MKALLYFVLLLCFFTLQCNEKKDNGSLFLERDYDFVLGFAVPDEDRLVPTEVFVGKLWDREVEELYLQGMQDSFLWEQVQRYYSWYRGEITYHEDAEVFISSETQNIQLQHTGYGTYRDVNNELHIKALGKYKIEIKRPGNRYYTDEVIVPGNIQILNITDGDTVGPLFPKKFPYENICREYQPVIWNETSGAQLYRAKVSQDAPIDAVVVKYATFDPDDQAIVAFYKSDDNSDTLRFASWETLAFDSSASIFYQSEGLGLKPDVDSFLSYWNSGNIEKRSTLNSHGRDDVIGNFGSYNAVRINFWIKARKDSCDVVWSRY